MPADGGMYVLGTGGTGENEWVSPRPVEEAVVEAVTASTDLTTDDLDEFESYVDSAAMEAHFAGEEAEAPFTFAVEGHQVAVHPDGTIDVDAE